MMEFWKSAAGAVAVELTSADISRSFRRINELGIPMLHVRQTGDLSAQFEISREDYRAVKTLCEKHGDTLRMQSRQGMYWKMKALLHRPVLILGMVLLTVMMFYIPGRVFFVEVEGNASVPEKQILEAAAESGIAFGASRREVRSEKMKNALLGKLTQLQWAGVNTYGCKAVITVRERADTVEAEQEYSAASIVAARDGVIESCTVTRGSGLCSIGQAVQEGQVLISGMTDCGLTIQVTRAEGEIMARTRRDLTVITLAETLKRGNAATETTKYSLCIGKKRINFYKGSGICDASCVKMYSEYVLTLPGGFELPVTLIKETVVSADTWAGTVSEAEASESLSNFASRYLQSQMIAGSIEQRQEDILVCDGVISLTGEYACIEMIGRVQAEQIGEYHGKTD